MNIFCGVGRITTDLKLQTTKDHSYCKFTIAIDNTSNDDTDFINCIIWGTGAVNLCKYQSKGNLISVVGKLHTYSYTTNSGEKRYSYDIDIIKLSYLESKRDKKEEEKKEDYEEDPFMEYQKKIDNEVIIDDSFLD